MSQIPISDSLATFVKEGDAFIKRNPGMPEFGGWVWAAMRAVAECDDCPGVFRVPLDKNWKVIYCPKCHAISVYQGTSPAEVDEIIKSAQQGRAVDAPQAGA